MKRTLLVLVGFAGFACLGIAYLPQNLVAQQGSQRGFPILPQGSSNPLLRGVQQPAELPFTLEKSTRRKRKPYVVGPEPNRDILVTPEVGEWMILIISYSDEENKDQWARQMVSHLRQRKEQGGKYELPAYVFNYGREERIKEEQRIEKYIKEQKERLKNLHGELENTKEFEEQMRKRPAKIYIRRIPVKEEAGVLVGAYEDIQTARRALESIKELPQPDSKKVQLDGIMSTYKDKKTGKATWKWGFANPFKRAFVVRNPSMPKAEEDHKLDGKALRHLNSAEEYSVFKCRKKYTLAIKQFRMPSILQQSHTSTNDDQSGGSIFGLGGSAPRKDAAAISAHNLAEMLRKMKFEAYVLHTQVSSIVTVGGFDSPNGTRIRAAQQQLDAVLTHPAYARLKLFPRAWPMPIPQ